MEGSIMDDKKEQAIAFLRQFSHEELITIFMEIQTICPEWKEFHTQAI